MTCGNSLILTLTLTLCYFISFNLFLNPLSFIFSNMSYGSTNQEESVFSSLSRDFENTIEATNEDGNLISENLINSMDFNSSQTLDNSEYMDNSIDLNSSRNLISAQLIDNMNFNSSQNLINNGTN